MDAAHYNAERLSANAIRRGTWERILQTLRAHDAALAKLIREESQVTGINKPNKHTGQPGSEWVALNLAQDLAEAVLHCLGMAEAGAVGVDGQTTPEASRAADLVDTWQHWLERNSA